MKKIKLGIVGCGIAAKELHLPPIKELKDKYEITALHNRTRSKAELLADEIDGQPAIFDSYEKMLEEGTIDAIDLALPTVLNQDFIVKAVDRKIPIICEKPISHN